MGLLELVGLAVVVYYLIYIVLWLLLDCNAQLWFKDRFGLPISTMRGQVVWITGASSGIGRALAVELARNGVRLVLSARRKALLDEVKSECVNESKGLLTSKDILVLPMDILVLEKHEEYFQQVLAHFGHLDVLVNNAGRSQRASWESIEIQVDRDLFQLDVFSVLNLSRIAVRYFLATSAGRGHVACTSSIAGFAPVPFSASYVSAKHALNAYMRTLKVEHSHLDVTIFAPGPIATDFLEEAFTAESGSKVGQSTKDQKRMTAERCGHLFAVSLANKLDFTWCGLFPVNFLAYVAGYPTLGKIVFHLLGRSAMSKIREGKI